MAELVTAPVREPTAAEPAVPVLDPLIREPAVAPYRAHMETERDHTGSSHPLRAMRHLVADSEHGSMTDAVTDALREAILSGALPPQTWLREGEISEALAVSRTPVREALRRLSGEGMTRRVANRGSVVANMSFEEILAVYAVRANLEGLAARLAALNRTDELVARLRELNAELTEASRTGGDLTEINLTFHRTIRDTARNPYLERFLVQVENSVRRFVTTTFDLPGRASEAVTEHNAVIDAIDAGDADAAERLATSHMRNAREARVRQMSRA